KERITWWITAAQYVGILSLWLLLRLDWVWYASGLFFLNITYVIWDLLHRKTIWKETKGRFIIFFDAAGMLLSVVLLIVTFSLPPVNIKEVGDLHHALAVTAISVLIIVQSIAGIITAAVLFKYNPIQYLRNDGTPILSDKAKKQI
ncbi:hypothetical protein KQH65_12750, partial [archaeon]|nr:hypothetical protein [archaeon]